ncbi:MAG TPA: NAD(P)-dependent oxidoreductase [Xanthobacteraceae bacterium]|nr:NAD(P)-dependent oxidoreductase [Xanthobacteraceae bacterium]
MASAFSFFDVRAKTVLLVGSGAVAAALMLRLLEAGARVRWLSQDVDVAEEIWLGRRPDRIEVAFRAPHARDFAEAAAVIVAASDPLASRVAAQARALDRPVAVAGRPELSTFDIDDPDDGGHGEAHAWSSRLGLTGRRTALPDRLLRALRFSSSRHPA